jgi:hypothetical protein
VYLIEADERYTEADRQHADDGSTLPASRKRHTLPPEATVAAAVHAVPVLLAIGP